MSPRVILALYSGLSEKVEVEPVLPAVVVKWAFVDVPLAFVSCH